MLKNFPRDFALPLRTLEPADPDVSDLEYLRDLVGAARVVSIGESAHGVREFYQLKDRLLRFLVSELGFTAFVMESGLPEGLAVNNWVLGGEGQLDRIARTGITYHLGECEEMRAQLQWMRNWNSEHDRKVRFYGMDVAGSGSNPGPAIAECLRRLEPGPEDAALLTLANLGGQFEAKARYRAMAVADQEHLSAGIAGLVKRASAQDNEIAFRCAISARCVDEILRNSFTGDRNPREELMASNVRWILEREERIVIGAHNGHIQRWPLRGTPMLGRILAPALADDMVVIGTTYASGQVARIRHSEPAGESEISLAELHPPPHTIDALMDAADLPLHLVDLRRVPAERVSAATAMLVFHDVYDIDPKEAFDALVHVRHVTTVAEAFEALREAMRVCH